MYSYQLEFAKYKLRPYERDLALKEFQHQFPSIKNARVTDLGIEFELALPLDDSLLKKLAFFSQFHYQNAQSEKRNVLTDQAIVEACKTLETENENYQLRINKSRQTRYLSHTFHEYKGRFYPQLSKALMNYAGLRVGDTVLDPFCGSGTTLVEGYLYGANAVGIDINPIAVMVANAKVRSLNLTIKEIEKIKSSFESLDGDSSWKEIEVGNFRADLDIDYLENWFPQNNIKKIIAIQNAIDSLENETAQLLSKVILSNLLRKYSYQDPSDLRIRRREDEPPQNIIEEFLEILDKELNELKKFQSIVKPEFTSDVRAYLGDIRRLFESTSIRENSIDAVVTSPPYATALPYVDTDRLSLFAFGFTNKSKFRTLEQSLIGNREISKSRREELDKVLTDNFKRSVLPKTVVQLLQRIYLLNKDAEVGFRRKNTAALLFKYFLDMHKGISEVNKALKKGKLAFFVVGNNRTVAGGESIDIPTDDFIGYIGEKNGFRLLEKISMTVQPAYVLHSKNSIKSESILVFRKK